MKRYRAAPADIEDSIGGSASNKVEYSAGDGGRVGIVQGRVGMNPQWLAVQQVKDRTFAQAWTDHLGEPHDVPARRMTHDTQFSEAFMEAIVMEAQ